MDEFNQDIKLKHIFIALASYLGLAPLWYWLYRPRSQYLEHHIRQALALFTMLFGVILVFILSVLALSYTMIFHREFFELNHLEPLMLTWVRRIFLCWLVFWVFGATLALLKSEREMPIVKRIMAMTWVLHITAFVVVIFYTTTFGILLLVSQSRYYSAPTSDEPKVVLMYDDVNRYPSWIFYLGFYSISRAAHERWGGGSVAIEKINPERLKHAIAHSRFIFLGTHGQAQGILMDGKYIRPSDINVPKAGRQLQYVYLTGCDSGSQREAWEHAFAPAHVVTYDRLTALVEHIWWLFVDGPKVVRSLEEPPPITASEKKGKKHKRIQKKS